MTRKKVTPVAGKSIPLADGNGDLPQKGKNLTLNSYWRRLETDGDVSFADPDDEPAPEAEASVAADGAASSTSTRAKK